MTETTIPARTRIPLLAAILLLAAALRFTGLNWDEGQWIHPDEGHMRIITASIHWPASPSLYFDARRSPLNSFNQGQSYSYGTLPLFLVRLAAEGLDRGCGETPNRLMAAVAGLIAPDAMPCSPGLFTTSLSSVVGRALSALADLGSVWLVYLIGRRLYGDKVGLLAALFAALTAFAIQQAHFYTVDSLAGFFTILTVYYAVRVAQADATGGPPWTLLGLAGLAVGLATACKLSAALAALFVALAGAAWAWRAFRAPRGPSMRQWTVLLGLLAAALGLAALMSLLAFRVAQPYAFEGPGFFGLKPYQPWWERMGQIQAEQSGDLDAPPGQQWTNRAPIWFPWLNIVVWGMGLPLGLAAWASWAAAGIDLARGRRRHFVLWLGLTLLFLYLSTRWVKTMRYFLPLYPLLAILAAYGLSRLWRATSPRTRRLGLALTVVVVAGAALWAAAVFGIYLRPTTRVAASRWVYARVPAGSIVANEHWDWGLPLPVDGHNPFNGLYTGFEMANYDADTPEKRAQLFTWLDRADYIFLASNRLYASISRLPERYPLTNAYYRALFAGELGFELAADFTSYPALGPFLFPDQESPYPLQPAAYTAQPQWQVPLPPAEEAFSVYDHPRILIFRKTAAYSRQRIESVLGGIDLGQARNSLTPKEATTPAFRLEWAWFFGSLAVLALAGLGVHLLSCRSSRPVL
jgi:4-amino-4-deoxy-L-arabinose transferase-like glycosyltransferase